MINHFDSFWWLLESNLRPFSSSVVAPGVGTFCGQIVIVFSIFIVGPGPGTLLLGPGAGFWSIYVFFFFSGNGGTPNMDGLCGEIPLKRMILGYPSFRKPPYEPAAIHMLQHVATTEYLLVAGWFYIYIYSISPLVSSSSIYFGVMIPNDSN